MKESTLKRNFQKWFDKFDPGFKFKDRTLSKIIPKSIEKGYPVYRKANYKSLVGKEIVAQYSKACNIVWFLVKAPIWMWCPLKNEKIGIFDYEYEIYAIEPENVVIGIFGPILYKVL